MFTIEEKITVLKDSKIKIPNHKYDHILSKLFGYGCRWINGDGIEKSNVPSVNGFRYIIINSGLQLLCTSDPEYFKNVNLTEIEKYLESL